MGIWHLSLVALTKENAENIKSHAKELNENMISIHTMRVH